MKSFLQTLFFFLLVTQIGFAQQDFWKQTNGPPAGNFHNSSFAKNSLGHIFCCSLGGFVYRSTDHGLSWVELTNGLERADYSSLTINRKDYIFIGAWWDGIYRSTDNGESWTKTTFFYDSPVKMVIDSSGSLLVATDPGGIIKSTDDGQTWMQIGGIAGFEMNCLAVNSAGHIFAGGDRVYRSTDNGSSWVFTGLNFSTQEIAFNSQGHVFVVREYKGYGTPSLYISSNNGERWSTITTLPPVPDGATYTSVAVNYKDHVFVGGSHGYATEPWGGAYRSTDDGQTWTKFFDLDCGGFLLDNPHTLIFTRKVGVTHSTGNGDHWQLTGPAISRVRSLFLTPSGTVLAGLNFFRGSDDGGLFYSSNSGSSWIQAGLYTKSIQCVLGVDLNTFIASTDNGIYLTTDYGVNWIPSGLPNTSVLCLEQHSTNGTIFAGTAGSGIYRSTDNGFSWSFGGLMDKSIRSLFTEDSQTIYAGAENEGIYRSVDGGISWSFVGLQNTTITSLSNIVSQIFAGTNSGVYKSPDNGTSWVYAGLNNRVINDILVTTNNFIYVATSDSGVYRSLDEGLNWSKLNTGLNHLNTTALTIDNNGYLYVGTDGGGVYNSTMNALSIDEANNSSPTDFILYQNYPNPFNPITKISWQSPVGSWQTLKIYDVLGNEVATIVDEYKPAGRYEVEFNAASLPSGVYFYRLQAGSFVETKKMILMK